MGTALAWAPVKPFSPVEPSSFASKSPGTRSKPIPVIVEPAGDVLVTVKMNVLPTNVHVTVAVEAPPVSTPTILTVSALAVAALNKIRANKESTILFKFIPAIEPPVDLWFGSPFIPLRLDPVKAGNCQIRLAGSGRIMRYKDCAIVHSDLRLERYPTDPQGSEQFNIAPANPAKANLGFMA